MTEKPHKPKCGAKTRAGHPCTHGAGQKTDHVGQGRCWLHGGRTPIKHGLYSKIANPRVKEHLDLIQNAPGDPMDLTPEVQLMRAMLYEFVNRFEQANLSADELDLASNLMDRAGRMIERIHKIKQTSAVTWEAVQILLERMGMVLLKHLHDTDLVEAIKRDWMDIEIPLAQTR